MSHMSPEIIQEANAKAVFPKWVEAFKNSRLHAAFQPWQSVVGKIHPLSQAQRAQKIRIWHFK